VIGFSEDDDICQRVRDNAFHICRFKGGSASPEDDGKQTAGGANIRRQSRIICERVEARLHRYLPEAAASLQAGAKHCGQDNAFHL
jgi:hypothetical protein